MIYNGPVLDLSLGRYDQNTLMHVQGHEHFISTTFCEHPLSSSVVQIDYVFPYIYMKKCTPITPTPFLHLNKYIKIHLTRVLRGTDRSPDYKEHFCYKLDSMVKNVTTEWNQKQQHFITHALDHCYEVGVLL